MAIRYYERKIDKTAAPAFDIATPSEWLRGEQEKLVVQAKAQVAAKGGSPRHYITYERAAEITTVFLKSVSKMTYDYIASQMPEGYDLPRMSKVGVLAQPHLGWTQVAGVRFRKDDGSPCVIRLHYANFNAKLDTDPRGKFFDLPHQKPGQMFFAVAFSPKEGAPDEVVIDRSVHHGGISFITDDHDKALANLVYLRTGMKLERWRELAELKRKASAKVA